MEDQDPEEKPKLPYRTPVLKEYGNLHLITRGSGGRLNDAGGTMRMFGEMSMMGGGMMGMQKFFG